MHFKDENKKTTKSGDFLVAGTYILASHSFFLNYFFVSFFFKYGSEIRLQFKNVPHTKEKGNSKVSFLFQRTMLIFQNDIEFLVPLASSSFPAKGLHFMFPSAFFFS